MVARLFYWREKRMEKLTNRFIKDFEIARDKSRTQSQGGGG